MTEQELYEHYVDTNSKLSEKLKERNKFFLLVFIPIFVLSFLGFSDSGFSLVVEYVKNKCSIDISENYCIFELLVWIVLLYFTMRYCQSSVNIERQYFYISDLEDKLDKAGKITREGKSYLEEYPFISDYIDFLYKKVFPFLYIVFLVVKLVLLLISKFSIYFKISAFLLGFLCFLLILFYSIFLYGINKKYKENSKNNSKC